MPLPLFCLEFVRDRGRRRSPSPEGGCVDTEGIDPVGLCRFVVDQPGRGASLRPDISGSLCTIKIESPFKIHGGEGAGLRARP